MNHDKIPPITAADALKAVEALAEVLSQKPENMWFAAPMLDLFDRIHAIKVGCEAIRAGDHRSGPARMILDRVSPTQEIVHILRSGRSLCGMPGVPSSWPSNHRYCDEANWPLASCKACGEAFTKKSSRSAAALFKVTPASAVVHIVRDGRAVCGKSGDPGDYAYLPENWEKASCQDCIAIERRRGLTLDEKNSSPGAGAPDQMTSPGTVVSITGVDRCFIALADKAEKKIKILSLDPGQPDIRGLLGPDVHLFVGPSFDLVARAAKNSYPDFTILGSE
jgi:hypothetical protein